MLHKILVSIGIVLLLTTSALAVPVACWLYFNIPDFFDDKPDIARADIKQLEQGALEHYKKRHHFPETFWVLEDRDPITVTFKGCPVIDPWGQPYQIDPHKIHPTRNVPLIWSEGKPGRNKHITNWD